MYLKYQNFQKHFFYKSWSPSPIFFISDFFWKDSTQKNDFESTNFDMFKEVVHNFGWHDLVKKCLFPLQAYMASCPTWSKNLGRTLVVMSYLWCDRRTMYQWNVTQWFTKSTAVNSIVSIVRRMTIAVWRIVPIAQSALKNAQKIDQCLL